MMAVCPEDLRFTQDSIKNRFKPPYAYSRIDDAVDQIRNKLLSPTVLQPLNVVEHKNVLWSLDNRRLWVLRKAGVATVEVNLVSPDFIKRSSEYFRSLDPLLERQYSSPDYFPRVRGPIRLAGINTQRYRGNHTMCSNFGAPAPISAGTLPVEAKKNVPKAKFTTPSQDYLKEITVRSNIRLVGINSQRYCANDTMIITESSNRDNDTMTITQSSDVGAAAILAEPLPKLLQQRTAVAVEAKKTVPNAERTTPTPRPDYLKEITVRSNIPVLPLTNISQQPTKKIVHVTSANNFFGHGRDGEEDPGLWRKVFHALHSFMDKGLNFLRFVLRAFNLGEQGRVEEVVRLPV